MDKNEIIDFLDSILVRKKENFDIPTSKDWENFEKKFSCKVSNEFKYFIELIPKYYFSEEILNIHKVNNNGNDTIQFVYDDELKYGLNKELIPFCVIGNGDYLCISIKECPNSSVYYYFHENGSIEKEANSFEEWIMMIPEL